jgi:hypothetical protein
MLIKGLNMDRPVILGRIKIGDKGGKKGAPRKFDHFKIYGGGKDGEGQPLHDADMQKVLEEKYGTPLRRIPIFLMYNSLQANFDSRFAYFARVDGKATCLCYGDGEVGNRVDTRKDKDTGQTVIQRDEEGHFVEKKISCPCNLFSLDPSADRKKHPCKVSGKLMFQLKDFPMGGGVFLFRTHSYHSVRSLSFALSQMSEITLGNMGGIPVDLIVEEQRTQSNRQIFVVRIQWSFAPDQIQLKAIEHAKRDAELRRLLAVREGRGKKLLANLDDEEKDDVTDEFYSTQTDGPTTTDEPEAEPKPEPVETEAMSDEEELAGIMGSSPPDEPQEDPPEDAKPADPGPAPAAKGKNDASSDFNLF